MSKNGITLDFSDPENYVDRHSKFTDAYYDPKIRFIFMKGGGGSGKSKLTAQVLIQNLDTYKILGVRKVKDTIKDSIHAELKGLINSRDLKKYGRGYIDSPLEIRFQDKTAVVYRGVDDQEKLKSIEGIDQAWIEEGTELLYDDFEQINLRVRSGNNNKIIITFNPINAQHRLKTKVEDNRETRKNDSAWIESTPFMNKFLPEQYLDALRRMQDTNPDFYKIYAENQRGQGLKGLIYPNYKVFDYDIEPEVIGLDFGYNDPTALTYLRVKDDDEKKKLYIQEKLYERELTETSLLKRMQEIGVPRNILIIADNSRPELIEAIERAGYKIIACDKGAGSIYEGIMRVKKYEMWVNGNEAIKETSQYCWKVNKLGQSMEIPCDGLDHVMDSVRYGTQYYRDDTSPLDIFIG